MPNYDYRCETCHHTNILNVKYNDRDLLQECPECGTIKLYRVPSIPMVLKASYPDGHKRSGWEDMKATARLQEAKAKAGKNDVKEINRELDARENKAKGKA